ncbi:MAG: DNA-binding protein [Bacillota bacterium]
MDEIISVKDLTYLLSDHHTMDKNVELLQLKFTEHAWDEILLLSDYLHDTAEAIYQQQQDAHYLNEPFELNLERSLVFYYGFSYLTKATALQKLGYFDKAKEYILKYSELGWFAGMDKTALEEVEQFRFYAKANLYTNELLEGNTALLPEYVQFLKENDEEVVPGLVTIMETATLHKLNVDEVLDEFSEEIDDFSSFEDPKNKAHYFRFLYHLTIYHIHHKRYEDAAHQVLKFLTCTTTINIDRDFKQFVALFEILRKHASATQVEQYHKIFEEMIQHEEGINLSIDGLCTN